MRVLGVDPGLTRCGLGVVDGRPGKAAMVAVGVVRTPSDGDPGERLVYLERELDTWLGRYEPDVVAVERVFADTNITTVMTTAHATAVALLTATKRGIPVVFHTPTEELWGMILKSMGWKYQLIARQPDDLSSN